LALLAFCAVNPFLWNDLTAKVMPDYQERNDQLRLNGAGIDLSRTCCGACSLKKRRGDAAVRRQTANRSVFAAPPKFQTESTGCALAWRLPRIEAAPICASACWGDTPDIVRVRWMAPGPSG
jgi:hypothetical protein